jgi:type II secretory pathway pseudopilin PulG
MSCHARRQDRPPKHRRAFTVVELVIVIGVLGLLVAMILPAVQSARETSRATECRNHLHQLSVAANAHEAVRLAFPPTSTTWYDRQDVRHLPISTHRHLMATLDPALFRQLDFEDPSDPGWIGNRPRHMSPLNQAAHAQVIPVFLCPSDSLVAGATNYRCNIGISVDIFDPQHSHAEPTSQRGAFVNGRGVRTGEFPGGLSTTAFFSERLLGSGTAGQSPNRDLFSEPPQPDGTAETALRCQSLSGGPEMSRFAFAGYSWLLGGRLHTWYHHILTPNSPYPDCGHGSGILDGGRTLITARSWHPGGVNTVMGDGAVHVVADAIDAQVWRDYGSRLAAE